MSKLIYVVDDEERQRMALQRLLRQLRPGTKVEIFDDPAKLFEAVSQGAAPDAVITDRRMPQMFGERLAERLREELGYAGPILMLTGDDPKSLPLMPHVTEIIAKPADRKTLAAQLNTHLGDLG